METGVKSYSFQIQRDYSFRNKIPTLSIYRGELSADSDVQEFSGEYTSGSNFTLFAFSWETIDCSKIVYLDTIEEVGKILTWSCEWFGNYRGNLYDLREFLVDEELNHSGNFYVVIDNTGKTIIVQSVHGKV